MPSAAASRRNLARWRERAGLRTEQQSLTLKICVWQWGLLAPEHRKPSTQAELAKALGISRRYVRRILKRTFFDAPIELLAGSPVTPGHVLSMRQRQEQYRRQQDQQAQQQAEDWTAAWREEEARAQQQGYSPEQEARNLCHANPAATRGEQELRRIVQESGNPDDKELAKSMFPWLKL